MILNEQEFDALMQRKRDIQAKLATEKSCGSSSCCSGNGGGCSTAPKPSSRLSKVALIIGAMGLVAALGALLVRLY